MRSMIVRTVAVALLATGLAACSGAPAPAPNAAAPTSIAPAPVAEIPAVGTPAAATAGNGTTAPTTTPVEPASAPADERPAIEKVFRDYNSALLSRNFATACSVTAPRAAEDLIRALNAQGVQTSTCEQAFAAVYAVPEAARPLDEAARSSTISDVTVVGDIASVTYSGEANGRRSEGLVNKMQRTAGQWQLLGNDA